MATLDAGPTPTWRRVVPVAAVALPILLLDQLAKSAVRGRLAPGERIEVLSFLDIVHVHNTGIAFGAFSNLGPIVIFATMLVAVVLFVMLFRLPGAGTGTRLAIGAIAGGALGNLVDRIRLGHVTDYVQLPSFPAFNLADTAITIGVAVVIIAQWRVADEDDREQEAGSDAPRG